MANDDFVDQLLQEAIEELDDMYNNLTLERTKRQTSYQQINSNSLPLNSGKPLTTSPNSPTSLGCQNTATDGLPHHHQELHDTDHLPISNSNLPQLDQSSSLTSQSNISDNQVNKNLIVRIYYVNVEILAGLDDVSVEIESSLIV